MRIEFTIPAVPVAQPRQRHRIISSGGMSFANNYTPTKHPVNAFKASARMALESAYKGAPLVGPLAMSVVFVFPRPTNRVWKSKPMPRERHTKKPDCDNLLKSLKDSLSGLAYADDAQICEYREVTKWIASGDEQPHVEVTIEDLDATTGG